MPLGFRCRRKHEASLPEGDMTIAEPFQGWIRSTEDLTSPERDGRLQLQGISVRTDVGHPAFSRPVGTQCNRKFVLPNLQRLGYCQTLGVSPAVEPAVPPGGNPPIVTGNQ